MRVVCFHTRLHPKAAAALRTHAPGAEYVRTPAGDTYAYGRELKARWTGTDDLVVVEGDKEIHGGVLPSFTDCRHAWCTFGSITSSIPARYTNMGLGCARFTAALQREVPFRAFEGRDDIATLGRCDLCGGQGGLCWRHLDARIGEALWDRAHILCDHGEIPHHHPVPGQPADDPALLLRGTPGLPPGSVALTFDDGPGPSSADLARLLRDEGVPGTFFVLGESVQRHGQALGTIRDCGHVIGLHGDRHRPFKSATQAAGELGRCAERVSGHLDGTAWFRPPYELGDWPVPGFAGPVGWHAQGRDWDITYRRGQSAGGCVDAIARRLISRHGGIALLHDFAPASEFTAARMAEADLDLRIIEVTTLLIRRLRSAGLTFTGLPQPGPSLASVPGCPRFSAS